MSENTQGVEPQGTENNLEEKLEELTNKISEIEKERGEEKTNLVEELKSLRKQKQEAEDKLKEASEESKDPDTEKVESTVKKLLSEEKKKEAEVNKTKALETFQRNNKAFHPDNDESGLMNSALIKEFEAFNTEGVYSVDDFKKFYEKAARLVKKSDDSGVEEIKPNPSTPASSGSPKTSDDVNLSQKELQLIKNQGWTEERYLKLKNSQPDYVARILKDA